MAYDEYGLGASLTPLEETMSNEVMQWMNDLPGIGPVDVTVIDWPRQLLDLYAAMRHSRDCSFCLNPELCKHKGARIVVRARRLNSHLLGYEVGAELCTKKSEAKAEQQREDRFKASGIPAGWRDKTLENFVTGADRVLRTAKIYAEAAAQGRASLIFGGPTGTGKTHLAVAAGLEQLAQGKRVLFASMPRLLSDIHTETMSDGISASLEKAIAVDLLILDDVGTQRETIFRDENIYEIINERYNHKRQIIVTTNAVEVKDIETAFGSETAGKRAYSRLCEMCEQWFFDGVADYRKKAAA